MADISQYVLFNGKTSDIRNVNCGVPQGSILGPLLFILYINDFSNVSDILLYVLFADDTNVFLNGRYKNNNKYNAIGTVKLYNWLLANKLTLNISKTHFMEFNRDKHKNHKIIIKINKVVIEQEKHTTFLGVIFDDNFNWSNHISYIKSKIPKGVGIICRAKEYFTTTALINLYNAFIFPYLIYCVEVWGNALSIHLTPLLKLQHKTFRIITFTYHRIDKDKLLYNTGILPFNVLVKHRIGLVMHKLSNGNVPKPLQNLYQCMKYVHHHFTRQTNHFHSMRGNNEFVYRTFVFQRVFIWNTILQNINTSVSYPCFKYLLKDVLLSNDMAFRYNK